MSLLPYSVPVAAVLLLFPSLDYCEVVGRPEAQIVRIVNVEQWRLARSPCGSLSMDEIM